ncbi:amidohydrolase family protein [Microbispora sp. NPDC049125]|uniref:amidohydrolase family protein n=1 Tax=Microbispora sp. NPDC049125 TaxID=3154929 RepID=UPI00346621FF
MRTYITGGTVVDTEPEPHALPGAVVVIEDGVIVSVGPDPGPPEPGAEVVDATGRIVMPGLVDTHRHLWQAVLRGVCADRTLGEYLTLVLGRLAPAYDPGDVYAGVLWGALEALDAGVTTVFDWSHVQLTPDHTDAEVAALRESGVRAVFAYGHPGTDDAGRDPGAVRRMREKHFPAGEPGLVTPAFAAWGPVFGPPEAAREDWLLARELDLRISLHAMGEGPVERLHEMGLLGPDVLFVHVNGVPDDGLKLIAGTGGTASVTPEVECRMGHGLPETGRLRAAGVATGLGADTVTVVPGDLFSAMRAALAAENSRPGRGDAPRLTTADVLRMATIEGAAAIGMDDRIGSLRPGKQADIVLLDGEAAGLAPVHDPVAAVVGAGPAAVDTVFVAGRAVKRGGRLLGTGTSTGTSTGPNTGPNTGTGRARELAARSAERLARL